MRYQIIRRMRRIQRSTLSKFILLLYIVLMLMIRHQHKYVSCEFSVVRGLCKQKLIGWLVKKVAFQTEVLPFDFYGRICY